MPCKECSEENQEPCCNYGLCEAAYSEVGISLCVHCGAEMFEENGEWFHHSQEEYPFECRGLKHRMLRKDE